MYNPDPICPYPSPMLHDDLATQRSASFQPLTLNSGVSYNERSISGNTSSNTSSLSAVYQSRVGVSSSPLVVQASYIPQSNFLTTNSSESHLVSTSPIPSAVIVTNLITSPGHFQTPINSFASTSGSTTKTVVTTGQPSATKLAATIAPTTGVHINQTNLGHPLALVSGPLTTLEDGSNLRQAGHRTSPLTSFSVSPSIIAIASGSLSNSTPFTSGVVDRQNPTSSIPMNS
ncbi:unnamed protein product [Protopolystoma xenopodis]|uniref:Uncharacterized protein n=1 Tax=Protopolystoma xenopodis TaxID=117903 RepID=A0A3S5BK75_9PLAT|nr:unnamed protein product [Protopolystoma xenopodis]